MLPDLWNDDDLTRHLEECPLPVEVSRLDSPDTTRMCGCGEWIRHTPEGVARAELDLIAPEVT